MEDKTPAAAVAPPAGREGEKLPPPAVANGRANASGKRGGVNDGPANASSPAHPASPPAAGKEEALPHTAMNGGDASGRRRDKRDGSAVAQTKGDGKSKKRGRPTTTTHQAEEETGEGETDGGAGADKKSKQTGKQSPQSTTTADATEDGGSGFVKPVPPLVDHAYTDYALVPERHLALLDDDQRSSSLPAPESEAEARARDQLRKFPCTYGPAKKNAGGVSTPFPGKLAEVLDRPDLSDIIGWQPHGRAFRVRQPKVFAADILPRYFKQTKFLSFTRQVNLWGFKRITRGTDAGAYYHPLFLRGRPVLSMRMKRVKVKGTGMKLTPNPEGEPNFYEDWPPLPEVTRGDEDDGELPPLPPLPAERSGRPKPRGNKRGAGGGASTAGGRDEGATMRALLRQSHRPAAAGGIAQEHAATAAAAAGGRDAASETALRAALRYGVADLSHLSTALGLGTPLRQRLAAAAAGRGGGAGGPPPSAAAAAPPPAPAGAPRALTCDDLLVAPGVSADRGARAGGSSNDPPTTAAAAAAAAALGGMYAPPPTALQAQLSADRRLMERLLRQDRRDLQAEASALQRARLWEATNRLVAAQSLGMGGHVPLPFGQLPYAAAGVRLPAGSLAAAASLANGAHQGHPFARFGGNAVESSVTGALREAAQLEEAAVAQRAKARSMALAGALQSRFGGVPPGGLPAALVAQLQQRPPGGQPSLPAQPPDAPTRPPEVPGDVAKGETSRGSDNNSPENEGAAGGDGRHSFGRPF